MEPKEKAEQLVEKFYPNVHKGDSTVSPDVLAKQCAIIAVEEILVVVFKIDEEVIKRKEEYRLIDEYSYWKQVQSEITAL